MNPTYPSKLKTDARCNKFNDFRRSASSVCIDIHTGQDSPYARSHEGASQRTALAKTSKEDQDLTDTLIRCSSCRSRGQLLPCAVCHPRVRTMIADLVCVKGVTGLRENEAQRGLVNMSSSHG